MSFERTRILIEGATTPGGAYQVFREAVLPLGFSSVVLGEMPWGPQLIDNPMIYYDLADPWPPHYARRGFKNVDPGVAMIASLQYRIITWAMIRAATRGNSHAARMFREAAAFGLFDGWNVVQFTPAGTIAFIGMHGRKSCYKDLPEFSRLMLADLAGQAIIKESNLARTSFQLPEDLKLSRREQEILPCIIEGLNNMEIAEQQSVSHKSIEPHISRLKVKFEVPKNIGERRVRLAVLADRRGYGTTSKLEIRRREIEKKR